MDSICNQVPRRQTSEHIRERRMQEHALARFVLRTEAKTSGRRARAKTCSLEGVALGCQLKSSWLWAPVDPLVVGRGCMQPRSRHKPVGYTNYRSFADYSKAEFPVKTYILRAVGLKV